MRTTSTDTGARAARPPAVHDARPHRDGGLDESRRVNLGIRGKTCNHRSGQVHLKRAGVISGLSCGRRRRAALLLTFR